MTLELLQKFCSKDIARKAVGCPFSQGEWTYATDGRILIRVPRMAEVPERDDAPKNIEKNILNTHPLSEQWMAIPDLPAPTEDICEHCGGYGEHECGCGHVHNCGYCDGSGLEPENAIATAIGCNFVSHVYLRQLKTLLPGVEVCPSALDNAHAIGIRFDGGEGVLMPMRVD